MEETESKPRKRKPSKAGKYLEVIAAMNGNHPKLTGWDKKYHIYEPERGNKELLMEDPEGVVFYVNDNALTSEILRFCNFKCGAPSFIMTNRDAQEIARMWMNLTPPISEPRGVSFKSDDALAFHRLPFDLPEASVDKPKLFEEFLSRCGNKFALAAFIGSLFDPNADRQQYVWLHGYGQNGKGALTNFLRRVLGPSCHSEVVPDKRAINNFWTSTFLGKRLVIFPECDQPDFPSSGHFKSLSGGDAVRIERKQKAAYSTELNCKFIFLSNEELSISSGEADQRRAIFCHVDPISGDPDPSYYDNLFSEAPYILRECIDLYKHLCPKGGRIPVEESASEQAALDDEKYISFFDTYFEKGSADDFVSSAHLQRIFSSERVRSKVLQGKFIQFWMRTMGVYRRREGQGLRRWIYCGLKSSSNVTPFYGPSGRLPTERWSE